MFVDMFMFVVIMYMCHCLYLYFVVYYGCKDKGYCVQLGCKVRFWD